MSTLVAWDWLIVAAYFAALIGVVWWSSRKQDTTADYFLAGRNIGFFAIGASLFASNIGSEHIVGLSGSGATTGMAMAHYELHAWIMVLLAWIFVPFYYRTGVYTVPEFLEKRFGTPARTILSVVSLLAYVLTKVSVTVYAGAKVFQVLLPETFGNPQNAFWVGAILTVVLTGLYTVFGGLRAVLYTDTAQALILLIGSACITAIGLMKLGGWGELQAVAAQQAERFALWRPATDPDFPWLGIVVASPIVGIWYWCTDQYIVQRTLSARDLRSARRGALFGGILKVSPVLLFIIPGMIGFALHEKGLLELPTKQVIPAATPEALTEAEAVDPGEVPPETVIPEAEAAVAAPPPAEPDAAPQRVIDADRVFPTMVTTLLPTGLRGLVVAGMLAALMSSLSSLFNSSASLFTIDIYEKLRPGRSERHLVRVGRIATTAVVIAGLAWIPIMSRISEGGLYHYLQSVQGYLAPPITAVFLLGLFHARTNAIGATTGLIVGFVIGLGKTVVQAFFGAGEGKLSNPAWLAWIGDANFLYFSGVLFVISVAIVLLVSFATAPPAREKIAELTWGSMTEAERRERRASWNQVDVLMTFAVLGLVAGIYLYFTFWA